MDFLNFDKKKYALHLEPIGFSWYGAGVNTQNLRLGVGEPDPEYFGRWEGGGRKPPKIRTSNKALGF